MTHFDSHSTFMEKYRSDNFIKIKCALEIMKNLSVFNPERRGDQRIVWKFLCDLAEDDLLLETETILLFQQFCARDYLSPHGVMIEKAGSDDGEPLLFGQESQE